MSNLVTLIHHPRSLMAACLLAAACLIPSHAEAQQVIRVPGDAATLQVAIGSVPNGGIIELAAGKYIPPSGGFSITDASKGFTIRAAAGALVTLSGEGRGTILRYALTAGAVRKPVTFERLVFANGASTVNGTGGALTILRADAMFIGCVFQGNAGNASTLGGGAAWIEAANISFVQCEWLDNTARAYGGGMSTLDSRILLRGCTFRNNRSNVSNHLWGSVGGAITNTNSSITADNCRFESNQSGYVGGAIFCGATWRDPVSTPSAELIVTNSLFLNNSALPDGAVGAPGPLEGGAVHVEDQTTARFTNCRFEQNTAQLGGAISSYRALTSFDGCAFDQNRATGSTGSGGSIFAMSADVADSSTANGTINRRPIVLDVRDTVFRGAGGSVADAAHGGAIFVVGDLNAAYGRRGVRQNGDEASNRATVNLTRVGFVGLRASGTGGAVSGAFTALTMDGGIMEGCSTGGDGGGLRLLEASVASVSDLTFARCAAQTMGGGLMMFGGTLNMARSNFVENSSGGRGAAMVTGPATTNDGVPGRNMTGTVKECVFNNPGASAAIYDGERFDPPFNQLQYNNNTIFSANPAAAYISDIGDPNTVAQLNVRTFLRSDGSLTIKSTSPNFSSASAQPVAAALMIPPVVAQSGAPGESTPVVSHIVYSTSGGTPFVDGGAQRAAGGAIPTISDVAHTVSAGSAARKTGAVSGAALNISTRVPVGIGEAAVFGGFIIQGNSPKRVILRGVGPSLTRSGVQGALSDPTLELFDASGASIATSDNWRSSQVGGVIGRDQALDIHSTGVAPASDLEPAIAATLNPNSPYTAALRGANNTTGVGLIEVYDLDGARASTLANISTRAIVGSGDGVMIGGFIYGGGAGATRVVVRAIGPSLSRAGIANALADPTLDVVDGNGSVIASNDDWRANESALAPTGLAPQHDQEAAILLNSPPRGGYTAVVHGRNGATGVALVEAYVFE